MNECSAARALAILYTNCTLQRHICQLVSICTGSVPPLARAMDSALVSAEMLALLGVDHLVQAGSPGAVAAAAGEGEGAAGVGEARHRQDAAATSTAPPPSAPAPAHASLAYVSQSLAAQGFGALPSEAEFGERPAEAAARVANAVQSLLEEVRTRRQAAKQHPS